MYSLIFNDLYALIMASHLPQLHAKTGLSMRRPRWTHPHGLDRSSHRIASLVIVVSTGIVYMYHVFHRSNDPRSNGAIAQRTRVGLALIIGHGMMMGAFGGDEKMTSLIGKSF